MMWITRHFVCMFLLYNNPIMKQKTLMVVVLALVVGGIVGFILNSNISGMKQGAAVSLSKDSSEPRTGGLEATAIAMKDAESFLNQSSSIQSIRRVRPDQIKSEVDITKITKDTKPFSVEVLNTNSDGTIIGPSESWINCGEINGGMGCCSTTDNYFHVFHNGVEVSGNFGNCVSGEWDLA